uniref:Serine-threonine/tyrosine-protein kinase catalytic domain-containing protein n=1 Tax=Leersia perrieri TaxID=77586 RepID=A0A0D9V2D5_9ORYZ
MDEVARVCKVACWCVQDAESARPSMGTVVQALEGHVDVNVPPMSRLFKVGLSTISSQFFARRNG